MLGRNRSLLSPPGLGLFAWYAHPRLGCAPIPKSGLVNLRRHFAGFPLRAANDSGRILWTKCGALADGAGCSNPRETLTMRL